MTTIDELKQAGLVEGSGFELTHKGKVWLKELERAHSAGPDRGTESDFSFVIHGIEGIGLGTPERGDDEDFVAGTTGLLR